MQSHPVRQASQGLLFLAVYLGLPLLTNWAPGLREAPFWLPSGVAVAGVWILGPACLPLVVFGTIGSRLGFGYPVWHAILGGVGSGLEAWMAVLILRRLRLDPAMLRVRDVLVFLAAAALAPVVSASLGSLGQFLTNRSLERAIATWPGWWRMNALGMVLVVPLVLPWRYDPAFRPSWRLAMELLGLAGLGLGLTWWAAYRADAGLGLLISYLALPVVCFPAVRLGVRGAAPAALVAAWLTASGTASGIGPFADLTWVLRALSLQLFVSVITVTPLLLGALMTEQRTATAERARSEALTRRILESMPDEIYRIRADGTYLESVPSRAEPVPPSPTRLGLRVEDVLQPPHAEAAMARVAEALERGQSESLEYELVDEAGTRRVREGRCVAIGPDEVLCVVRDITSRRRAQDLEVWYGRVLERMAGGATLVETLRVITSGMEQFIRGGACSALILRDGRLWLGAAPSLPEAYNRAIQGLPVGPNAGSCGTAAYANRTVVVTDIESDPSWAPYKSLALPHGLRACWSVPIRSGTGAVLGTFAVYYRCVRAPIEEELALAHRAAALAGIAIERERREAALHSQQQLLESLNRNVTEGLYRGTPAGGLLYANQAMARMFGFESVETMLGDPTPVRYAEAGRRDQLMALLERNGAFQNVEVEFVRRDGASFWALVSGLGIRGPDGTIEYYDGAVADITTRRTLEDQLRQALKMEAVGKLAGGVAHDFNNLLTAIGGYAEDLKDITEPGGPAHQDAVEIASAASRAAQLTRQLLAFSRKQLLVPQVLDPAAVVDQMVSMLRRLISEDIRLVIRHAEPARLLVDRTQFEQVILNLVLNARDAMPDGGVLSITTGTVDVDEEFVQAHHGARPGRQVLLTLEDTGVGMEPETLVRAFDPFFTTKEQGKGTGLGLSTVYGIVKQSGGGIWLESQPGGGTRVLALFPLVAVPEQPATPAPSSVGLESGSGTVLVAEDEPLVRDLVVRTLTRTGYRVLAASHGQQALELAAEHQGPIDLLVTDMVMPRMGGRELASRISRERPETRVLFMSGYPNPGDLGAVTGPPGRFLPKPFTPADLTRLVRQVMGTVPG